MGKRLQNALFFGSTELRKLQSIAIDKANCRCVRYVNSNHRYVLCHGVIHIWGFCICLFSDEGQCEGLVERDERRVQLPRFFVFVLM